MYPSHVVKAIEMCASGKITCHLSGAEETDDDRRKKTTKAHLGVDQPAVVERDVEQIEHDAFGGVLEDPHASELHIHIQTRLQLVQHGHGIAHVLEHKESSPADAKGDW